MNAIVLFDRIVVERVEEESGPTPIIITPDAAKEKPQTAKVVAAGPGRVTEDGHRIPMTVGVGNLIMFGKYSGQEIKVDGKDYLIMLETDVLLILKPPK